MTPKNPPNGTEGLLTFPGLIDCHVHFREPGYPEKGTMETESRAAIAGGVTTVCEMPNTNPPTVTVAALADKVRRAEKVQGSRSKGQNFDMRFFFGITEPAHLEAVRELWTSSSAEMKRLRARCPGVKLYFDHSTGDQKVEEALLDDVFRTCADLGIVIVCHCEDPMINAQAAEDIGAFTDVSLHSLRRPCASEAASIRTALNLAAKHGSRLHIAHISTAQAVALVRGAKGLGMSVTCEVAPHHLFLTVEDYDRLGGFGKMNPPLRTAEECIALWEGITDGTIDCISTDHAPHTKKEKEQDDPADIPAGVPGVETMLPLLLTVAGGKWPGENPEPADDLGRKILHPKFTYDDIVRLCFDNPNRIFNLGKKKEGASANAIVIDPTKEWTIRVKDLHSKCGWTPYEGWKVRGRIVPLTPP